MKHALIIGAGPAGLMAAEVLAEEGISVTICDAKPSFGRKFLMAGKSGLNLTKNEGFEQLIRHYEGDIGTLHPILAAFDAKHVMAWTEGLGQSVFTGSSGRVFPRSMKASPLLRAWLARLDGLGVQRLTRHRWAGFDKAGAVFDTPDGRKSLEADVIVLALGGASWARLGSDGAWASILQNSGATLAPFAPANAAIAVSWSSHMRPFMGQAIKAVCWRAGDSLSRGEAILSARGLEGGGVYSLTPSLRKGAALEVDLIPDIPAEKAVSALKTKPARLRLSHWLRNTLHLPAIKSALFYEGYAGKIPARAHWVESVKAVPVPMAGLQPMDDAISTAGGVAWDSLTDDLMLKARPGVFCAGEMLDWEAPTGGYLLTACLASGRWAGAGALRYLAAAA